MKIFSFLLLKKNKRPIILNLFIAAMGFLSMLFLSVDLYGQTFKPSESRKANNLYQEAVKFLNYGDYSSALIRVSEAIKIDKQFLEAYLLQAEIDHQTGDIKAEIGSYLQVKAIDSLFFPYLNYNLGLSYWDVGEYTKARSCFIAFRAEDKGNKISKDNTEAYISKCNFAIDMVNHPVPYEPKLLGDNLNSPYEQYWPSLTLDAQSLIFTMLMPDSTRYYPDGSMAYQEDFYMTQLIGGIWQKPEPLGPPINTKGNEGAQQISADGNILVFTGCNRNDGVGLCDIYFSIKDNSGNWQKPIDGGRVINTASSEKQPCLSPDGQMLYFSSDRPGGLGKMDIWVSALGENGQWGRPRNLGKPINTPGDDICPFIHPDNQTLYFSSDGHPGMGLKDIFISRRDSNGQWSQPVNLGYPINTCRDEIGLVVDHDGKTAYFASNFNSTTKKIYTFTLPEASRPIPVSYVKGLVYDSISKKPLKADVQLLDLYTGDTLMSVLTRAGQGDFLVSLPVGKSYALHTLSTGYLFNSYHFDLTQNYDASKPYNVNIAMEKPVVGSNIILQNIFFKVNSFELLPTSNAELLRMEQFIKANPTLKFEVGGHTDNTGDAAFNQQLSEKRAQTVYNYLIMRNIPAGSLEYKGYGQNVPVKSNDTAEGKAANRRTELKVVGTN